VFELDIR